MIPLSMPFVWCCVSLVFLFSFPEMQPTIRNNRTDTDVDCTDTDIDGTDAPSDCTYYSIE